MRGVMLLLMLLAAGVLGCSRNDNTHSDSIPDIPPGRSRVGPEAGEQLPVAPPAE